VKPSPARSPRLHSIRTQLPCFLPCRHNGDADPPSKQAIRSSDLLPYKATGLGLSPLFCHFLRLCACWLPYKGPWLPSFSPAVCLLSHVLRSSSIFFSYWWEQIVFLFLVNLCRVLRRGGVGAREEEVLASCACCLALSDLFPSTVCWFRPW
jgi:hypothetical protein